MTKLTRRDLFVTAGAAIPAAALSFGQAQAGAWPPMPSPILKTDFSVLPPGPTPGFSATPSFGQDVLTIIFDDAVLPVSGHEGAHAMRTIQGVLSFKMLAQQRARSLTARLSGLNVMQGTATATVHLTIGQDSCTWVFQNGGQMGRDFLRDMCVKLYRPATSGLLPVQLAMSAFNPNEDVDSRLDIDSLEIEFEAY